MIAPNWCYSKTCGPIGEITSKGNPGRREREPTLSILKEPRYATRLPHWNLYECGPGILDPDSIEKHENSDLYFLPPQVVSWSVLIPSRTLLGKRSGNPPLQESFNLSF
eukprot:gb/GECG01015788.1/.p1 GENE.gb/GECG01015788.1/~~gb/GECG01015788.1/.p1  ORF type:complete len:109 (+),score=4.27 gb/GECG01015788.1/:1-327(+)